MKINKKKLSKKQKGKLENLQKSYKKNPKTETSAQDTIPFKQLFRDGILKVDKKFYSKTLKYEDINYQLANNEDKKIIFGHWCDFLNYFDESIHIQFNFINTTGTNKDDFEEIIDIKEKNDNYNEVRTEFKNMLKTQLSKGNNGLTKSKYITFGVKADNYEKARGKLERIEIAVINNFRKISVKTEVLNGEERLKLLHNAIHMNNIDKIPFNFKWEYSAKTGQSPKDYIAPSSFNFGEMRYFKTGEQFSAVSFLQIFTPEMSDRMLSDFLDLNCNQNIAVHISSIDHVKAIKMIKSKLTDLQKSKIDEQKKAVSSGYDMDILSSDLNTYVEEIKNLLQDLQGRNERLFYFNFVILNTDKDKTNLENTIFQAMNLAQQHNCVLTRLDYQQEEGFGSTLPLGVNFTEINRGMTTSAVAGFMPFTTSELFQGGESLYYGLNALSNNLIMADRKLLNSPCGIILGTPGSGKSFSAKREIFNVFIKTDDDIFLLDPEGEYASITKVLGGQVIKISSNSKNYINPMDIVIDPSDPLSIGNKNEFIFSLMEVIMTEITPIQRSIIDRCLDQIYTPFLSDPVNGKMPILEDLYNALKDYDNEDADYIAESMAVYVTGSLNVFNHLTNVEINNRIVSFNTKELGNSLKGLGMLIIQEAVWNRVALNRNAKKSTRYYIDELHLLLNKEQTALYTVEIWKRFRKWGGIPTGLTQNVKDFLASSQVSNIFENSDFIILLNQKGEDRKILAERLNISPHQLSYVTNANAGEGLISYGGTMIPFIDKFPKDGILYKIMTTRLAESEQEDSGDIAIDI